MVRLYKEKNVLRTEFNEMWAQNMVLSSFLLFIMFISVKFFSGNLDGNNNCCTFVQAIKGKHYECKGKRSLAAYS